MLVDATLPVPASLRTLLAGLAPLFTAPSFRTFCGLACGFLAQTGKRTVCGMLAGAGLARSWNHDRAHRFFSRARSSSPAMRSPSPGTPPPATTPPTWKITAPALPGTPPRPSPRPPIWPPSSAGSSSPPDFRHLALTSQPLKKSASSAWPGKTSRHNRESRDHQYQAELYECDTVHKRMCAVSHSYLSQPATPALARRSLKQLARWLCRIQSQNPRLHHQR
jgi:hypothetical protein